MMTVVVIALAIQIIIIAQIHTVLDHESGGTRTPTLAVHNTRVIPLSQAPAGSQRRSQKMLEYECQVYSIYPVLLPVTLGGLRSRPPGGSPTQLTSQS